MPYKNKEDKARNRREREKQKKTSKLKPTSEYEEFKTILGVDDPEEIRTVLKLPDYDKQELREWYKVQNTQEVKDRRFEYYYFLKSLVEWLNEKNLEFEPQYLVSEYEIACRKRLPKWELGPVVALNKIPHNHKNRIVTSSERETLYQEFLRKWKAEYPADAESPHSLL